MNVGAFACIPCMKRGDRMVEQISDLSGMSKTHPKIAFALLVFMFSMAGVPPLAGFFAKLYIFWAAIDAGLIAVAVIGVLTSVIGAFYYLRIDDTFVNQLVVILSSKVQHFHRLGRTDNRGTSSMLLISNQSFLAKYLGGFHLALFDTIHHNRHGASRNY